MGFSYMDLSVYLYGLRWEIYMLKYMVSYMIKVLTIWGEGLKCMMICKDVMTT